MNAPHTDGPRRWTGFTLIEVLIVVAIIAILVAIMVPALGSAREHARAAKCLSNMHQVGVGFQTYRLDWRNYMPTGVIGSAGTLPLSRFVSSEFNATANPSSGGSATPKLYADILVEGDYQKMEGFDCPSQADRYHQNYNPMTKTYSGAKTPYIEMAMNSYLDSGDKCLRGKPTEGVANSCNPILSKYEAWRYTLISHPAQGILLLDNALSDIKTGGYERRHNETNTSSSRPARHFGQQFLNVLYFDNAGARVRYATDRGSIADPLFDSYDSAQPNLTLWRPWQIH